MIRSETEIDFRDFSNEAAPVVMVLHGTYVREVVDWGGPVPIRMVGDQHYLPLMPVSDFEQAMIEPLAPRQAEGVLHGCAEYNIYQPIRNRLYNDLGNHGGLVPMPWPSKIELLIRPGVNREFYEPTARAFDKAQDTLRLRLDQSALEDVERSREFFIRGFEGYVAIDGVIWRPIPEPCYHVSANTGMISSVIPWELFPSVYNPESADLYFSASHFFAADQFDEVMAFTEANGQGKFASDMLMATGCKIDVLDHRGLNGHDMAAIGLYCTAMEIRMRVGDYGFPTKEIERACSELHWALDASEGPYSVSSELETAVRAVVALEEVGPEWYHRLFDQETCHRIALQLERQDTRPIEVIIPAPAQR